MFFFYLYLGHLISDYLLQPNTLIEWKKRSRWGIFVHAGVHFLVTTLLAYLYTDSYYSILLAAGIASCHFVIDCLKVDHDNRKNHTQLAYWTDQLAHFLTVTLAFLVALKLPGIFGVRNVDWNSIFQTFYFSPVFVTYSCVAIFSTLTVEYGFFVVKKNATRKSAADQASLSTRHMIKRLFLATLIYVGLLFSLVPSVGFYFGS